jgi:hypothetical protein
MLVQACCQFWIENLLAAALNCCISSWTLSDYTQCVGACEARFSAIGRQFLHCTTHIPVSFLRSQNCCKIANKSYCRNLLQSIACDIFLKKSPRRSSHCWKYPTYDPRSPQEAFSSFLVFKAQTPDATLAVYPKAILYLFPESYRGYHQSPALSCLFGQVLKAQDIRQHYVLPPKGPPW